MFIKLPNHSTVTFGNVFHPNYTNVRNGSSSQQQPGSEYCMEYQHYLPYHHHHHQLPRSTGKRRLEATAEPQLAAKLRARRLLIHQHRVPHQVIHPKFGILPRKLWWKWSEGVPRMSKSRDLLPQTSHQVCELEEVSIISLSQRLEIACGLELNR